MVLIVTPFVGVWIETYVSWNQSQEAVVTPFVGVWIETRRKYISIASQRVTPFVGVWIETNSERKFVETIDSHTLRGCVD